MTDIDSKQRVSQQAAWLVGLGAISGLGYALLLWLSWQFNGDVPSHELPTLWMLLVFAGQFLCYGLALRLAVGLPPTRWLLGVIFAGACLFRAVLLPSIPMHEIDIHRYIWDGAVFADGVSPYRYSPQQVVDAVDAPIDINDATLRQLAELQASSESLGESLREIHYGRYSSPYPLVSQAVFALSAQITPSSASQHCRLIIMKSLLVMMDLATLIVVTLLLIAVGLHPGWSLAYGWCPLLMKEIANGGHLDSIAIFLTTLAVCLLVRTWQASLKATSLTPGQAPGRSTRLPTKSLPKWVGAVLTSGALALAIGAKLYPVVLLPLFLAVWMRRHGWATAVVGLASTTLISAVLLYPLFQPATPPNASQEPAQPAASTPDPTGQLNAPVTPAPLTTVDPADGVQAFLNHWEMNDLLFMVVLENLRQQTEIPASQRPWFVFTSDQWSRAVVTRWAALRQRLTGATADATKPAEPLTPSQLKTASFLLARVITGSAFAVIACLLAWRAAGKSEPHEWCRAGMLTLAWFWLTCPTQNPWYWCWVLPLLPFARYRTWYFVAAVTMLYYLRFWLSAQFPEPPVLGTSYNGAYFFYFVITWVEFVPCLLALTLEWFWGKGKNDKD